MSTQPHDVLADLRKRLQSNGFSGLIIPHGDMFQNEYLPACFERLKYVTGFGGSAGLGLVFLEHAYVFVDGRYTLAAQQSVDLQFFQVIPWTAENLQKVISDNLPLKGKLAYDPWTVTEGEFKNFYEIGKSKDIALEALETNWIDEIWQNRPKFPEGQAYLFPEKFAGESCIEKCKRLASTLKERRLDAAYLALPESMNWLLNIRGRDVSNTPLALCSGILHADETVDVFIPIEKVPEDIRQTLGPKVRFHGDGAQRHVFKALSLKKATILVDAQRTPVAVFHLLKDANVSIQLGQDPCLLPKALKNIIQQDGMRSAHVRDGVALVTFLAGLEASIEKGARIRETEAAATLDALRAQQDLFDGLSFDTISATGPNGAIVHYHPEIGSDRELVPNDVYLLDSGAQYKDGTTDVTRTIFLGKEEPSQEIKTAFTLVLKGHINLARQKFPPGTTGNALDVLARQHLWNAGLDYEHGTGHGVGSFLSVHEGPQGISKRQNACTLQPGMVISNEPGYYKAGHFGIRLESLVLVTPTESHFYEFETLTMAPLETRLVDRTLLNSDEKAWLNEYHQRVYQTLAPLVSEDVKGWLYQRTQTI